MNILRLLTIADLFTVGNLCRGLLAVCSANQEKYSLSAALIALAVVFDTIDGKIAGWLHQQHDFGKQLDSLADPVTEVSPKGYPALRIPFYRGMKLGE